MCHQKNNYNDASGGFSPKKSKSFLTKHDCKKAFYFTLDCLVQVLVSMKYVAHLTFLKTKDGYPPAVY